MQDTPSQTQQATEAKSGGIAFPLVVRLVALVGATLFALAAWLPWVTVYIVPAAAANGISHSVQLLLTPGTIGAPPLDAALGTPGALFIWSVLTVLGVPLAALAWMRVSRPIAWLIVSGYGLWLLLTLIFSITSMRALFGVSTITLTGVNIAGITGDFLVVSNASRDADLGLWLSGLALLICLAGLWTLVSSARRPAASDDAQMTPARQTAQTPGAGTLTFGLVLWAVGFLWMAWASLGCPSFVLVSATCQGLSADGAMNYAISRTDILTIDPRVGEYAISILLATSALFIGVGVWRRGVSAALCGWATIWLVAAAAFAALAWYGVNLVVNDPTLASASGSWRGESGILFTTGALLICLVGAGLLWFALLFHRTQTSSG